MLTWFIFLRKDSFWSARWKIPSFLLNPSRIDLNLKRLEVCGFSKNVFFKEGDGLFFVTFEIIVSNFYFWIFQ